MKIFKLILALLMPMPAMAQYTWQEGAPREKADLTRDVNYTVEVQGSYSRGKTPLWLNANRYGLSSLDKTNGYLRAALIRPLCADSARRWGVG